MESREENTNDNKTTNNIGETEYEQSSCRTSYLPNHAVLSDKSSQPAETPTISLETPKRNSNIFVFASNQKQPRQQIQVNINDLLRYDGLAKLRELAKSAKTDPVGNNCSSEFAIRDSLNNSNSTTPLDKVTILKGLAVKNVESSLPKRCIGDYSVASTKDSSSLSQACSFTASSSRIHGVRKSLEAALAKTLVCRVTPTTSSSQRDGWSTSTPLSNSSVPISTSTVATPNAIAPKYVSRILPTSRTRNPPVSSKSLIAEPRLISSVPCPLPSSPISSFPNLSTNSFLASHDSTFGGGTEEIAENDEFDSLRYWSMDEKEEQSLDVDNRNLVSFMASTMDKDMNSELDWSVQAIDTQVASPVVTNIRETSTMRDPNVTVVAVSRTPTPEDKEKRLVSEDFSGDAPSCLLVLEKLDLSLAQTLREALECSRVLTVTPGVASAALNKEEFDVVWVRVHVPVSAEILELVSALRNPAVGTKSCKIIAIAEKMLPVELLLRGFDAVLPEPLTVTTIRRECGSLLDLKTPPTDFDNKLARDISTPGSSVSLDSTKSQIADGPSNEMELSDFNFNPCKLPSSMTTKPFGQPIEFCPSPSIDSPPTPAWCKVEHATKEKQRRERIKESCDQLRKLLPYVRGRKTDMASILEMTVDYIKIVTAALPQDIQCQIVELLSKDVPTFEGRVARNNVVLTVKDKTKMQDVLSLGKALYLVEKNTNSEKHSMDKRREHGHSRDDSSSIVVSNESHTGQLRSNSSLSSTVKCGGRLQTRTPTSSLSETTRNMRISASGTGTQTVVVSDVFKKSSDNCNQAADNNANIIGKLETATSLRNGFHKRELPMNLNLMTCKAKKAHVAVSPKIKEEQSQFTYSPVGPGKSHRNENNFLTENVGNQNSYFSGVQFPHMFTEGDISANRMFSTGHVTGSDIFPFQAHSHLTATTTAGRLSNVSDGEMFSSVNSMYFDTAYYYYPSLQDTNNGNFCFGVGGNAGEYVNPNAVFPDATRLANFNIGRRYDPVSNSGDFEHYTDAVTGVRGTIHSQKQLQRWRGDQE